MCCALLSLFSVRALHLVCLKLLLVFNLQRINNPQTVCIRLWIIFRKQNRNNKRIKKEEEEEEMCVITAAVILQNLFFRDFLMVPLKSFPLGFWLWLSHSLVRGRMGCATAQRSKLCTVHFLAMIQQYKSPPFVMTL